jgi:DNA ligase-1
MDTLDLVFIGFEDNRFILACYDDKQDEFISIGLIKSFKDDTMSQYIHKTSIKDHRIVCMIPCEFYVYPKIVMEVSYDRIEASQSKRSPFFIIKPKFIRIRQDKNPEHATTLSEIESLYTMQ